MGKEKENDERVALPVSDLEAIGTLFKNLVEIEDRKYGFPAKNYERCFVGEQAVQEMIARGIAADEDDAVRLGNLLLDGGVFHHVQRAHSFKNEYLFYRFADDEDHGRVADTGLSSAVVKWADFLSGSPSARKSGSLQADIPGPDDNLGNLEQVDLEAIGVSPLDDHNAKLLDNVHPREWVDPEPKPSYNLVVIGAGAGGLVSAAAAAGVGGRVALIESHLLGGDCLNVGCVPSKALLRCAKTAAAVRDSHEYGIRITGEVDVDFGYVMERMRRLRAKISPVDSAKRYSDQLGIDVFQGRARFTGENSVEVNGKTLTFSKAVIATGGTAVIPAIPGLAESRFLTNGSIFNLTKRPERLGVIGAGPIGIEMAQAFQRLGSQVTVFTRDKAIMPREDADAVELVMAAMKKDGVEFVFHADFKRIEGGTAREPVKVILGKEGVESSYEFEEILVATGRKPAIANLGLEAAGVESDDRKGVLVNERLQTSNPDIYAVGDVASRYQFTHMADFMARLVIKNSLFFGRDSVEDLLVPWATYSDPEIAHVGLYEKDLEERGLAYSTFTREFSDVDRAIVDGEENGFVKIHVAKGKGEILGATIVGSHAGDMISEISVAIQAGMSLGTLASVIHPYPTQAEAIRQCGDAYNRERLTPTVKSIFHTFMALRR